MDRKLVMEMFNKRPRIGTLSTSNKNGDVNVAVFGSPQMIDEETIVMGIGNNRSLGNLKENPKAVFIVMEPGKTTPEWKGYRIYLKADTIEIEGPLVGEMKSKIVAVAGEAAAERVRAAIRFKITEVRGIMAPA